MLLDVRNYLIPEWKGLENKEQRRVWLAASKLTYAERTTKPLFALIAIIPFLVHMATSSLRGSFGLMMVVAFAVGGILELRVANHARAILRSPVHGATS